MKRKHRYVIVGPSGMVGSAIWRAVKARRPEVELAHPPRVDLRNPKAARRALEKVLPCDVLFLCAARVGGIRANIDQPAEFIYDNMMIQTNVIEAASRLGCELFVFLGSSCIYPKDAPQPIPPSALMTGRLEETNSAYAMSKLAGIEMLRAYEKQYGMRSLTLMPCNLYGPGDNYDPATSHVVAALIHRFHHAKQTGLGTVHVWGTGNPRREVMHVDDFAAAALRVITTNLDLPIVNIGVGWDLTIRELAHTISDVVGYRGLLAFDNHRPDGVPAKLLDITCLRAVFGWDKARTVEDGLAHAYRCFQSERLL